MNGLSRHARIRLQQRGIPLFMIELLHRFGSTVRSNGAETVFFDRQARKELRRFLGGDRGLRLIEEWLNVFTVVADDGAVVTAGHRVRHLQRDRSPRCSRRSVRNR